MRRAYILGGAIIIAILIISGVLYMLSGARQVSEIIDESADGFEEDYLTLEPLHTLPMQLTSTAFAENETIPASYTCDGDGINPPLAFEAVPDSAASLVLIMDDPDAPAGVWDHWVVWNIDPSTTTVEEGVEPVGVRGTTTSQTTCYVPPCPPGGEHRYVFTLYALDTKLELPDGANRQEVDQAMDGHILEQAELIGRYSRP